MTDLDQSAQFSHSSSVGAMTGTRLESGAHRFLGIPFATASRMQPPIDLDSLSAPFDATTHGPICPQTPGTLEMMLGSALPPMAEDCLSLNIHVPGSPDEGGAHPVLFWVHGGAYVNGAGSIPWYDGARLAARGCVVVTINYRLGALGYLGASNLGTLDQISALRWVNKHIASFGGDPGNVTIFGESAGGSAVVSLLASPDAAGLFHRAWAMSPSIGQLRGLERAAQVEAQFLEAAGLDSVSQVPSMPLDDLLAAQSKVLAIPSEGYDIFAPVGGGPGLPADILGAAAASPVPFVVGTTRDENKLFTMLDPAAATKTTEDWVAFCQGRFGQHADTARATYEAARPGETPAGLISAVLTDVGFRQHSRRLADARATRANPTWMYWFTWQSPALDGLFGSCHALDIPFAFDNLSAPGADFFTGNGPERAAIADRFAGEIVHFAVHGHPTWSQFDVDSRDTLVIDEHTRLVSDPEPEIRALFS